MLKTSNLSESFHPRTKLLDQFSQKKVCFPKVKLLVLASGKVIHTVNFPVHIFFQKIKNLPLHPVCFPMQQDQLEIGFPLKRKEFTPQGQFGLGRKIRF